MSRLWWCFTHNNPDGDNSVNIEKTECFKNHQSFSPMGGVAVEKGDSGTTHLQGFLKFPKPKSLLQCKKLCAHCHWEPMKGTVADNMAYVSGWKKDAEFPKSKHFVAPIFGPVFWPTKAAMEIEGKGKRNDIEDMWLTYEKEGMAGVRTKHFNTWLKYPHFEQAAKQRAIQYRPFKGPLRTWQRWFINEVKKNDNDRVIHWLYDEKGGIGKSKLAHFLRDDGYVQLSGPVANMAYMLDAAATGCLFDITRTQAESMDHIYQFAEQLKNGYVVSGKYHTHGIKFTPKTIIIFSNFKPDPTKWSSDRYLIYTTHLNAEKTAVAFSTQNGPPQVPAFNAGGQKGPIDAYFTQAQEVEEVTCPFALSAYEASPEQVAEQQVGNQEHI